MNIDKLITGFDKLITGFWIVWGIMFLISITIIATLGWVAYHFISKYW